MNTNMSGASFFRTVGSLSSMLVLCAGLTTGWTEALAMEGSAPATRAARDAASVASCYGRGHDLIFKHLGGDQSAALALLRGCFAEDVKSEFYFFNSPEPVRLANLNELVSFIENFALTAGYHSARNTPDNLEVSPTGPRTARLAASGVTPHFSIAPATPGEPAFVDWVSARYQHKLQLDKDGIWRTTRFVIHIDEIWRAQGAYPLGQ